MKKGCECTENKFSLDFEDVFLEFSFALAVHSAVVFQEKRYSNTGAF